MLNDWIDQEELAETWHDITLDSYIVDVRRVRKTKRKAIARLLLKSASTLLSLAIYLQKRLSGIFNPQGKRLTGSFGSMHGVKIPENLADEMPDDQDLPYLEMLYKFVFGKSPTIIWLQQDTLSHKRTLSE